ncbi:MAG: T9SS type A sorting domain-containing protein [Bacteroidia bacterium]
MIKKLLSIACLTVLAGNMNSQSFSLYYTFASVTGTANLITVDPTPAPTANGVTSGSFTAVGTGTGSTAGGVFSFVGWDNGATSGNDNYAGLTGSVNLNKYYEISLTPQSNYVVTLNSLTFGVSRSGTGVRTWVVRTNKDNYTTNAPATYTPLNGAASASVIPVSVQSGNVFFWNADATTTPASFATNNICGANFSGPNFTNQFTPYILRLYAYNAEAPTGTFRIDTARINGTATFSAGVGLPKLTHDLNANFKLYPNPTNEGIANLEATGINVNKVEVLNIIGAVVASQNVTINEEKIKLDLATLPTGTYFVRISSEKGITTEKLIIAK